MLTNAYICRQSLLATLEKPHQQAEKGTMQQDATPEKDAPDLPPGWLELDPHTADQCAAALVQALMNRARLDARTSPQARGWIEDLQRAAQERLEQRKNRTDVAA